MRELILAAELFETEISNGSRSLEIYYTPQLRPVAVSHYLAVAVADCYRPTNLRHAQDAIDRLNFINKYINENFWGKVWPLHEVHFHKNFTEFAMCPYTCAEELVEVLRKIGQS